MEALVISSEGGTPQELGAPVVSQADPNWASDSETIIFGQPPRYYAEPHVPRAIYSFNLRTNEITKPPGSEGWS